MALMTRSIEMSFSASRLRRTVTSISIGSLLVRTAGGSTGVAEVASVLRLVEVVLVGKLAELHLHPAWSEFAVAHRALRAVNLQRDALLIRVDHTCCLGNGTVGCVPLRIDIVTGQRHYDQPADRATPVPGLRQGPVDPRRGHLQGVGRVAHHVLRVKTGRDLPADLGDVVQADAAVGVDDDAQDPAPPGGGDLDRFQVDLHRVQHGLDQARDPGRLRRAGRAAPMAGAWPAAAVADPPAARAAARPCPAPAARVTPRTGPPGRPRLPGRTATGALAHHASSQATLDPVLDPSWIRPGSFVLDLLSW